MKRLALLSALILMLSALTPAAFADEAEEAGGETTVFSAAQEWKAQMIAEYFTEFWADDEGTAEPVEPTDPLAAYDPAIYDAVVALRTGETAGHAVGWGALYKLMLYLGPEKLADFGPDGGLAIGQLRKAYFEELEATGGEPGIKNLGQLKKEQKAKDGWMPPGQKKKLEG